VIDELAQLADNDSHRNFYEKSV